MPISEVSRWLGHRSITTTVDLYGHLVAEASGRARDAVDHAFGTEAMYPKVPRTTVKIADPQVRTVGGGRVGL